METDAKEEENSIDMSELLRDIEKGDHLQHQHSADELTGVREHCVSERVSVRECTAEGQARA